MFATTLVPSSLPNRYSPWVVAYNLLQFGSTVTGTVILISLSLVTIVGLLPQKTILLGYQRSLILMATVYLSIGVCWALLCPMQAVQDGQVITIFQLAIFYPEGLSIVLMELVLFVQRLSVECMSSLLLYRTCLVLRRQWAKPAGILLIASVFPYPVWQIFDGEMDFDLRLVCDLICLDNNYTEPKRWKIQDLREADDYLDLVMFFFVVVFGVPCIIIIERSFKNGNYSAKTLAMQRRLTWSMAAMIIAHFSSFLPFAMKFLGETLDACFQLNVVSLFLAFATLLMSWTIPIKAWILYLSCKNVLKPPKLLADLLVKIKLRKNGQSAVYASGSS